MKLNIECKEPEVVLSLLRNLYINEEVVLVKNIVQLLILRLNLLVAMKQSIHWKVSWSLPRIFRHIK